ncbi:MAG TPA: MFS transporter [Thermoplasmata archaeon]|nr:MFS transporter [Thermoplasmata archaeon]
MASSPSSSSPQRSDWFSIGLLSVVRVFRSVAAGFINLMFPYFVVVQLFNKNPVGYLTLGYVYVAATFATALLGLLMGYAADTLGRKATFLIALAMLPASTGLLLLSQTLPVVYLAAAIGGYSATGSLAGGGVGGVAAPIQSALITDLSTRHDRTFLFGALAFISGIAAAFGALGAGFLGTSEILVIATALGTVSLALGVFIRDRTEPPRGQRLRTAVTIGKFSLTGILNGASQGLVTPFLIPFFILIYDVKQDTMGIWATVSGLVAAFSLLLAPWIERRLGFLRSIYVTRGGTILLALAFPVIQLFPASLALYCIFPSLRVMAVPVQQSAMMDLVSEGERGRALGINQGLRLAFSAVGTGFTGYEFNVSSIYIPFVAYAAVMTGNLVLYRLFFHGYESPEMRRGAVPDSVGETPGPAAASAEDPVASPVQPEERMR